MATAEDLGSRKQCFTCKQIMECRQIEYNGEVKYQWQDGDGDKAHFKYDEVTRKTSCKNAPKKDSETPQQSIPQTPKITLEEMRKTYDKLADNKAQPEQYVVIGEYLKTLEWCELIGITEPPVIGMIFNKTMDRLN